MTRTEEAAFAAGCFWGVEAAFSEIPGVIETTVGYMGGTTEKPTYESVCAGKTRHAETVHVVYDPQKVTYEQLLERFWTLHDPTLMNRQGPDIGTQYRSMIFYYSPEQVRAAENSRIKLQDSLLYKDRTIQTEIAPHKVFYRAEEYHQQYYKKHDMVPTYSRPLQ
jgi:peptide-methionine (S)-S-oxide reductase